MKGSPRAPAEYKLQISSELEGRLSRCRASIRGAIRERLQAIAAAATKGPVPSKAAAQKQPPLRFYVYEGYRVFYQVDAGTRRVVVLDLSPAKA
jgi:mRNA-degrading endonuclease RelE of RelBE toxin-antitoxin system